jgi:hypothetical protein
VRAKSDLCTRKWLVFLTGSKRSEFFILMDALPTLFWANLAVDFPKTDAGSSTILRDELHAGFFQGLPQFHNSPFLSCQGTRPDFESLHAGKRDSGRFREVTLLPPKKSSRCANLFTCQ